MQYSNFIRYYKHVACPYDIDSTVQGRSQDFSKGGGGGGKGSHCANIIVMAFSPQNIVGCLLKKRLTKGGSRAPQDPPLATPLL